MDINDVVLLANKKMSLTLTSYTVSFVAIIIIAVLTVALLKAKNKNLTNNLIKIVPMIICVYVFFSSFIAGINAHIIAIKLEKDSREMVSYSISGEIEGFYTKAKTMFIVIDSNSYICMESKLNLDVSSEKKYDIKYLINSKLIIEMKEIN